MSHDLHYYDSLYPASQGCNLGIFLTTKYISSMYLSTRDTTIGGSMYPRDLLWDKSNQYSIYYLALFQSNYNSTGGMMRLWVSGCWRQKRYDQQSQKYLCVYFFPSVSLPSFTWVNGHRSFLVGTPESLPRILAVVSQCPFCWESCLPFNK